MLVNKHPLPEQCFPRALSLRVSAGEALPPNKLFCISWQMALLKELWICVGLFLFAASAAWSILRKVNWPLSSPGHWQDGIHNECTSSSRCSSMSGLTSDPFSTNSARHRRCLTPFPREEQTPAVYQTGCKISYTCALVRRTMHPVLCLVKQNSSCSLFSFFTILYVRPVLLSGKIQGLLISCYYLGFF